jgi:hypothetical protein
MSEGGYSFDRLSTAAMKKAPTGFRSGRGPHKETLAWSDDARERHLSSKPHARIVGGADRCGAGGSRHQALRLTMLVGVLL